MMMIAMTTSAAAAAASSSSSKFAVRVSVPVPSRSSLSSPTTPITRTSRPLRPLRVPRLPAAPGSSSSSSSSSSSGGPWFDLANFVATSSSNRTPFDDFAASIGKDIYIDVQGWHLFLRDVKVSGVEQSMAQALATKIGGDMMSSGRFEEREVEEVLRRTPVVLGRGKVTVSLMDVVPSILVDDLYRNHFTCKHEEVCSRTHTARMDLLTGGEEAPGESVQGMGGRIGRVEGEIGPGSSEFDATDSKTNDANADDADDSSTQRRHREPPPPPPGVDIGELRGLHLGGDEDVGPALTGCSRHSRPPPPPPPVKDDAGDVTDQTYAVVDGLTVEAVDAYFREADTNGTGRIVGGEAMVFFLRTGIPVEVLSRIWQRVRPPDVVGSDREQGLTRHQFSLFLRLVAYVQGGYDLGDEAMVVHALDPEVWVEAGMPVLKAPVIEGTTQGEATGKATTTVTKTTTTTPTKPTTLRRSNTYTDAKHPPLAYEVRYPPLREKESAKLAGLVGVGGFLMAYPSFENGLLVWGRAEGNLADVQLATEEEDGLSGATRSLLRFAHHGAQKLPLACPREDKDAAQSVEVKHLTHKDKKISCCYMERSRGILWVADKEGYVSAYSTEHMNAKAVAKDHLLHRWRAARVGYVTCMTTSMNRELWTGNNRGIIRVWPHTAGGATFSGVFNPFAEDCEHKGRELRKGTFDRAHNSKILALVNSANGHTIWSVSKRSMLIWDVGSGICFGAVGEGSGKDGGGRETAAAAAPASSPSEYSGTGIISRLAGLDIDPLNGSILWRPAREDYDYCHSQQESWAALSERGVVELTERITEGAERAVSFFGKLMGDSSKKSQASTHYRPSVSPSDTLVSHESSGLGRTIGDANETAGGPAAAASPRKVKHQIVTAVAPHDDTIWIGWSNGVISVFESAGKLVENVSLGAPERMYNTNIRCMSLVGREVWVGTLGGDIHRISIEDRAMQGTFRAHSSPVRSIVQTGVRAYALAADGSISGFNIDQDTATNTACQSLFQAKGADCYSRKSLGVLAVTWNVGESRPDAGSPFFRWIAEHSADKSMIIVALQEVEMGGASVALAAAKETLAAKSQEKGNANAQFWANAVAATLGRSWQNVSLRQLSGMLIIVFARSNLGKSLGEVRTTSVACGILGVGGNKGAVAVHLSLYRHRMVFVCSHFAAHQNAVDMRNANYHTILQGLDFSNNDDDAEDDYGDVQLEFVPSYPSENDDGGDTDGSNTDGAAADGSMASLVPGLPLDLSDVQAVFWMGDLNYRIDGQYDSVCKLAKEREYPTLLLCDQLLREHQGNRVFRGFVEAPIAFQPTYKFDKGSLNTYDTSEKKRVPAWCDRILYYTRLNRSKGSRGSTGSAQAAGGSDDVEVEHVEYSAWMDVVNSDHKPVFGSFKVSLTKLDAAKKRNITASILSDAVVDVESVGIPRFVLSPHTVRLHPFHNPEGIVNLHNKGDRDFFFSIQSGENLRATGKKKGILAVEIRPVRGIVHAGKSVEIFIKAVGGGSSGGVTMGVLDVTKFIVCVYSEYAIGGGDGTMHEGVNGGCGTVKTGEFNVVSL